MPKLEYAAICRGYTVLVSYQDERGTENAERYLTDFLCTFSTETDIKASFYGGSFKFHLEVQSGVVFACGAIPEAGVRLPFLFLTELSKRFNLTSLPSRAYNAEEHEFDREFKFVIKDILDKFNSGNSGDPQQVIQGQLHSVESIMHQNIAKTLKRGAQLEDIVAQTEALENQSLTFRTHTVRVRRAMWLQNVRLWIIIGAIALVVIVLLGLWIDGKI
ncbi:vesicle-associated membrane protein 714-like isoform X1 [Varroa destructor]|uniref:Vesicle-associated membrane protein 7 n=1 Tax=Varroa destructor TaxID=109461 RepID=A0A7M7MD50_VARDE|nr:vesicle-associated membrane protein 714-like isoform X1 [Varroa destructor]XP_022653287.1 vesicle-associated membrane protein 714-like isoform X1 [Varroa destructor]XP_022653288.1 vesicle-associated membrane protein 714-like isoform X1 [Varroa destructor]XP_022653289.1 vesicle-associated membrane protein 714-like isoform X1 [Varroa destructor]